MDQSKIDLLEKKFPFSEPFNIVESYCDDLHRVEPEYELIKDGMHWKKIIYESDIGVIRVSEIIHYYSNTPEYTLKHNLGISRKEFKSKRYGTIWIDSTVFGTLVSVIMKNRFQMNNLKRIDSYFGVLCNTPTLLWEAYEEYSW